MVEHMEYLLPIHWDGSCTACLYTGIKNLSKTIPMDDTCLVDHMENYMLLLIKLAQYDPIWLCNRVDALGFRPES